ncbi:Small ubiquitin-related modifier, SUMO [Corchorus capsularis]|uniref:Small ubiquitin-related modifier, SUMO n=1 Tax=Corchorus capsularis TaxID=210143 RepID=A0A1R3JDQ5_COCAP|nr:Small ubiquitin-related modifier, SUMO [Corchorus capsularis]
MARSATQVNLIVLSLTEGESPLLIRLQTPMGYEFCYKIGRKTPLFYMTLDFCQRMGLIRGEVRFTYDGTKLDEFKTPDEINLEDDDVIDVWPPLEWGG